MSWIKCDDGGWINPNLIVHIHFAEPGAVCHMLDGSTVQIHGGEQIEHLKALLDEPQPPRENSLTGAYRKG